MNIIITMAGQGQRFRDAGYSIPKYEISVHGRTLFSWSLESLRKFIDGGMPFIFIARGEDHVDDFVAKECRSLGIEGYQILHLDTVTDGQATTALFAGEIISDPDQPIGIYNIDTYVNPEYLRPQDIRGDGWIPCFPGEGDHWSFARLDPDGRVVELREKIRISDHATVGFYWFRSFKLYKKSYDKYYGNSQNLESGEKYIAPLYNQLILDGAVVYISEIPSLAVHCLGTPGEVEVFATEFSDG